MTIREFAEKRWANVPVTVLQEAGIRAIRSHRSTFFCDPFNRKEEQGLTVFDYPDYFAPKLEQIFRRLIKAGFFMPEEKKKRARRVKPVYSVKNS